MRTWRLLLLGFGNVGQGTVMRLRDAAAELAALGCDPRIVGVVDPVHGSVASSNGLDPGVLLETVGRGGRLSTIPGAAPLADSVAAIREVDADIVFEMTPTDLETGGVGLEHVRAALAAGRHVCTTNKGPVALAWQELSSLAETNGVQLRCEGTVMSGTPVLNVHESGLRGAGVRSARGILNGTCNFILSAMEGGQSYGEALAEAQALGYAETDPTGDVEGFDAAAKVAILANLVLDAGITLADVQRTGITGLDAVEVRAAVERGERWRLVGAVEPAVGGWNAVVEPRCLPASDPLAAATGPTNMVVFDTEALGEITIVGPGAGREATGHALVTDLLAIHRSSPEGAG